VIAASLLLLAASIATFLFGVFGTGLTLIGTSIGCALASALCLGVGVMRDSRKRPAMAGAGSAVSSAEMTAYAAPDQYEEMEPALEPVYETADDTSYDVDESREDFFATPATESYQPEAEPAMAPPKPARARKPAARKPAARKPAAKKAAAKSTAKKAAPKKAAARKPAAKPTAKKAAPKKAAPRKPSAR